jgi:alkaline phosphatase D
VEFSRRRFVVGLGAAGAAALTSGCIGRVPSSAPHPTGPLRRYPFTLGVASGEPAPDGMVLWTRLAPDPLLGGGMPDRPIEVHWQVAGDEDFHRIMASGTEVATPEFGHCVHAEVHGLQAGSWYWYRFRADHHLSPVGRTRCAPQPGARTARLAFALTSCQCYASGFYTAHRHMATDDLDAVIQVGDYIYEGASNPSDVRPHEGTGEPVTLEEYRNRHAQYRTDEDLQACHAAFPWLVVLDDHEIANGWADEIPQDPHGQAPAEFRARRAAAFQAYFEHMPLRRSSTPHGIDMQLYRRVSFGDLLDVHLLDTRQYRSDQDRRRRLDPSRTILGDRQKRWLLDNLAGRTARWNAIAQQMFFSQLDYTSGSATSFNGDSWDNYQPEREALRDHIASVGVSNPVILTGDVHANYVCDVKTNFADGESATVATELVGTSISSFGDGVDNDPGDAAQLAENPHIKFINRQRGYLRNVVTANAWVAEFRVLDYVTRPGAAVTTRASFAIENGRPGALPA